MRAWHLVGLPGPADERLRFYPPSAGIPLWLPSSIPSDDQEQVIAFYQQVITEAPLPRAEVDWYREGIDPGPRRFLEGLRMRRGSSGTLLVIKVRADGVDGAQLLQDPVTRMFEHTVVASSHPIKNALLANLTALTKLVEETVRDLYNEMVEKIDLRPDGWSIVRPLINTLLNPVDVVETVNGLVDIQLEDQITSGLREALQQRLLDRLLLSRTREELVVIIALLFQRADAAQEMLGEQWDKALGNLQAELLLHREQMCGWLAWLADPQTTEMTRTALDQVLSIRQVAEQEEVRGWYAAREYRDAGELQAGILRAHRLIDEKKYFRARAELDALEPDVNRSDNAVMRQRYQQALGSYLLARKEFAPATSTLQDAIRAREPGEYNREEIYFLYQMLAEAQYSQQLLKEATTTLRKSLDIQKNLGRPQNLMVGTRLEIVRIDQERGKWPEVERQLRSLLEEEDLYTESRALIRLELASGLLEHGRHDEAWEMVEVALQMRPVSFGTRWRVLVVAAKILRDKGGWEMAEKVFSQARDLIASRVEAPEDYLAITLDHLARGLRDNGRWGEAEPLFREAIRLKASSEPSPYGRAVTLHELARGLQDNGQPEEGNEVRKQALALVAESTFADRRTEHRRFVVWLRRMGREEEAERIIEVVRAQEAPQAEDPQGRHV